MRFLPVQGFDFSAPLEWWTDTDYMVKGACSVKGAWAAALLRGLPVGTPAHEAMEAALVGALWEALSGGPYYEPLPPVGPPPQGLP